MPESIIELEQLEKLVERYRTACAAKGVRILKSSTMPDRKEDTDVPIDAFKIFFHPEMGEDEAHLRVVFKGTVIPSQYVYNVSGFEDSEESVIITGETAQKGESVTITLTKE